MAGGMLAIIVPFILGVIIFVAIRYGLDWSPEGVRDWVLLVGLPVCYLVGTICAQAKDAASKHLCSLGVGRDLKDAWRQAWSSRRSAEFVYRSIAWAALAIAAALLVGMFSAVTSGCSSPAATEPTSAAPQTTAATVAPATATPVIAETAIPTNTPPAPSHDRAALVALYNATDGANWYNNTNWLSDAPLSEWHGVTTTLDGRVAELSLRSNNLSGEIPAQLGDLANLKALGLAWNRLNGEIPTELSHLAELMLLDLRGDFSSDDSNELTGEIPPELGNLANLRALVLDDNQLTGEIPPELGNLTNLRSLSISHWSFDGCGHGRLTGEIPPELGNLTHLHQMRFNGNQLTGEIPTELGNLGNLGNLDRVPLGDRNWLSGDVSLDLSCNQLTGEIPSELGNLSGLHWLRLNDNELTGEIPATLGKLDTLEILELGNNRLGGCIPTALQDVGGINPAELGLSFCE